MTRKISKKVKVGLYAAIVFILGFIVNSNVKIQNSEVLGVDFPATTSADAYSDPGPGCPGGCSGCCSL